MCVNQSLALSKWRAHTNKRRINTHDGASMLATESIQQINHSSFSRGERKRGNNQNPSCITKSFTRTILGVVAINLMIIPSATWNTLIFGRPHSTLSFNQGNLTACIVCQSKMIFSQYRANVEYQMSLGWKNSRTQIVFFSSLSSSNEILYSIVRISHNVYELDRRSTRWRTLGD